MPKMTLDINEFDSDSLRKLGYVVAQAGPGMRLRGDQMRAVMHLRNIILVLESRVNGGDTSELRGMLEHNRGLTAPVAGRSGSRR